MEQIRQILSQLALHLELNIAMCDKIDSMEKRLKAVENSTSVLKTKTDAMNTRLSEFYYSLSDKAYSARKDKM